jgi:hypothetical protein
MLSEWSFTIWFRRYTPFYTYRELERRREERAELLYAIVCAIFLTLTIAAFFASPLVGAGFVCTFLGMQFIMAADWLLYKEKDKLAAVAIAASGILFLCGIGLLCYFAATHPPTKSGQLTTELAKQHQ